MVSPIPARTPSERAEPQARSEARAAVAEERSAAALDFTYGACAAARKYATCARPTERQGRVTPQTQTRIIWARSTGLTDTSAQRADSATASLRALGTRAALTWSSKLASFLP